MLITPVLIVTEDELKKMMIVTGEVDTQEIEKQLKQDIRVNYLL